MRSGSKSMLGKALALTGAALLGIAGGAARAEELRPAGAGTGEAVAWVYLRGGSHVNVRAAGKLFPVQVGTPLLRSDQLEVPASEFVVVRLRNGYVVKIDEETTLSVAKIVSLDAPPTKESLTSQLDRVLTKEERGRAERIAGTQSRLAGADSVAPQSDSALPAAKTRGVDTRGPGTPAKKSLPPTFAPPAEGAAAGDAPPPGAPAGGYPPQGAPAGGYPPPGAFPTGGYPPAAGAPGAASPTGGGAQDSTVAIPPGALVGKIVNSFRAEDGTLTLYLNKGKKDKLRVGMTGEVLEGSEGGRLLVGATFTITKVIGANQAVATARYDKSLGKNNRFLVVKKK